MSNKPKTPVPMLERGFCFITDPAAQESSKMQELH